MWTLKTGFLTLLLLISIMAAFTASANLDKKHPNYVRAVLINKITPYIYWRTTTFSAPEDPIKLCIVDRDKQDLSSLMPYMDLLKTRKSGKRAYIVESIGPLKEDVLNLPSDCHIYYLAGLNDADTPKVANIALANEVLTIGDSFEELQQGAMIAFIEQRGKMKIYVNTAAVEASKIKLKSSLLRIAKKL